MMGVGRFFKAGYVHPTEKKVVLSLPMLRLLSSKAQERKDF